MKSIYNYPPFCLLFFALFVLGHWSLKVLPTFCMLYKSFNCWKCHLQWPTTVTFLIMQSFFSLGWCERKALRTQTRMALHFPGKTFQARLIFGCETHSTFVVLDNWIAVSISRYIRVAMRFFCSQPFLYKHIVIGFEVEVHPSYVLLLSPVLRLLLSSLTVQKCNQNAYTVQLLSFRSHDPVFIEENVWSESLPISYVTLPTGMKFSQGDDFSVSGSLGYCL